jgi:hypothetical protein
LLNALESRPQLFRINSENKIPDLIDLEGARYDDVGPRKKLQSGRNLPRVGKRHGVGARPVVLEVVHGQRVVRFLGFGNVIDIKTCSMKGEKLSMMAFHNKENII